MTLNLRIQHRGGPYFAHVHEVDEKSGNVIQSTTLKQRGDEFEVAIWKGKILKIDETDPFETDAYA